MTGGSFERNTDMGLGLGISSILKVRDSTHVLRGNRWVDTWPLRISYGHNVLEIEPYERVFFDTYDTEISKSSLSPTILSSSSLSPKPLPRLFTSFQKHSSFIYILSSPQPVGTSSIYTLLHPPPVPYLFACLSTYTSSPPQSVSDLPTRLAYYIHTSCTSFIYMQTL